MQTASHVPLRRSRRLLAGLTSLLVATAGFFTAIPAAQAADVPATTAPLLQRTDDHVTADDLPTVQINDGYVWAQTIIGNTVYAVGQFSNVRPAGAAVDTNLIARSNILAYDITTGELIASFAPTTNGPVKAIAASPDGKRIYIGGSFNNVNGQSRHNFAALDATTGQLVPGVAPAIGGSGVYALAATDSTVYVGGLFTQANGVARENAAAFSTSNGALTPWAPTTDRQIDAMIMEPQTGQVIIGGRFYATNSQVQRGLANLDPVSGAINTSWDAPNVVKNGWSSGPSAGMAGIFGLASDATGVYGTGWTYDAGRANNGNLEGVFAAEVGSGNIRWVSDCHGDHYGVYSTGSIVYTSDHTHGCETVNLWSDTNPKRYRYLESYTTYANGTLSRSATAGGGYADWSGTPSPSAFNWFPDLTVGTTSGLDQAALSITGTSDYISVAGEFGTVNNMAQQGITRFATKAKKAPKQGPRVTTANWVPTANSVAAGSARISIPANWDRDDLNLTYNLYRDGATTPVASQTATSTWWNLPTISFNDRGLTPGQSYTYTVKATDPDGNSRTSSPVTVTVASGQVSPYAETVLDANPSLYYRLGGSTVDWGGNNNPLYGSRVSTVTSGGVVGSAASSFNGSSTSIVSSSSTSVLPAQLSEELWFKTNTTRGGKLIGYGNKKNTNSGSHDRHVYMTNAGKLVFGAYPGAVKTITSPQSYNDNTWHHMVATLGTDGMKLYVDGALVASDASVTNGQNVTGYWRIGGDTVSGWPSAPSSAFFSGQMNDVAIYPTVLSAEQVALHYGVGKGLTPPTASFTATESDLDVSFDASASAAASGHTISSYKWDFGDGETSTQGPTTTHTYAAAGTYQVKLTVTDNSGLPNVITNSVTVETPNTAPTAAFSTSVDGLTLSVDGSTSTDPDGAITGYSWNWGDGTPDTTGRTASHTYGAAGDYTVTLTVTDNRGGTATTTETVTVTHEAPTASFTSVQDGLKTIVDGTGSTAEDGATLSYAWNWGDNSAAGTGATASHTYAEAGTYTVTLTVTDSLGETATTSQDVTVTALTYAASDDFSRNVVSGWGSADIGGTWTAMYGAASAGSVDSSTGKLTLAKGTTRYMALQGVSLKDTEASVQFSLSAPPAQGNSYVGISSRQNATQKYQSSAWMRSDGSIWLLVEQSGTLISSKILNGVTWKDGDVFNLKTRVSGSSPTTIEVKLWKEGSVEPTSWQLTMTDSTDGLQGKGYTSLYLSRASSATAATTASFDSFRMVNLEAQEEEPEATPPTASFSTETDDMDLSVDGTASAATGNATITSYAWNWGDNSAAGTGATATHTYTTAGTYTVTLTVTDNNGLTGTTTKSVTIADNTEEPEATPPTASFSTETDDMDLSVDGTASAATGNATITSYAWNWGDNSAAGTGATATHTYTTAGTYTVTLTVTDNNGLTGTTTKSVTVADTQEPEEPAAFLASDDFARTLASGWGSADKGGAWTSQYWTASATRVTENGGEIDLPNGKTKFQVLNSVPARDVLLTTDFSLAQGPSTGASYIGFVARSTTSGNYQPRVWMRNDGSVWLVNQRGETVLNTYIVPGLKWNAGDTFTLKAQVVGSDATTIQAKVWKSGTAEPSNWQITSTDSTPELQKAGTMGVTVYRSTSATGTGTYTFNGFRAAEVN